MLHGSPNTHTVLYGGLRRFSEFLPASLPPAVLYLKQLRKVYYTSPLYMGRIAISRHTLFSQQ